MKSNKKKLLFVCLGNICRSPAAEGVMKSIINANKANANYEVDSVFRLHLRHGSRKLSTNYFADSK